MATHYLIAINGDYVSRIDDDPYLFVSLLEAILRNGGGIHDAENLRGLFGTQCLTASMDGVTGAVKNYLRKNPIFVTYEGKPITKIEQMVENRKPPKPEQYDLIEWLEFMDRREP